MNVIIVESKNDKAFILALVKHLNITNTNVDEPIIIDDESCFMLNGSDANAKKPTTLTTKIKDIKTDFFKKGINNLGILLDLDDKKVEEKIDYVNNAIESSFNGEKFSFDSIKQINKKYKLEYQNATFNILCHFTNFKQQGELETVLKNIVAKDCIYADCLESWKKCIESKGKSISQKDFNKFWLSNYLRFDTCSKDEQKQAGRKCSFSAFDYVMNQKAEIFNLDSDVIKDLRSFILLFKN